MLSFFHLTVFETMFRLKSVTLASEALDIPQPTLSRHLKFLRDHFHDPLFVRTRSGMEPTSIAQSASIAIAEALEIYRTRLNGDDHFDPSESRREFLIAASDTGHLTILPWLETQTAGVAPYVRFKAVPLGRAKLWAQLQAGEVDIGLGSFPNLFAGVREQTLFRDEYVCVVPKGLVPNQRLSLAIFKSARHVLVEGHVLGHIHQEVEKKLVSIVGRNNIRIVTESFSLSASIAEQTNLILTTPSRATAILSADKVYIMKPPVEFRGFDIKQYWHERFDHDPGNMWLRTMIAKIRRTHSASAARLQTR